jgi:hypothetical protein
MSAGKGTELLPSERISIRAGSAWARLPWIGAGVGAAALAASLLLGTSDPKQFAFSWLVAFLFFLSLALGAIYFVLILYAMQGGWGIVVRRLAENMMATVPLFAILFIPVLLTMRSLYPWLDVAAVAKDHVLLGKEPYLNRSFFLVRAGIYFLCWSLVALAYARASRRQDATGDLAISARLRRFAGPSIVALGITQTFASIDWIMSLDPHWYSTIFGVYWFAGSLVSFFALLTLAVVVLQRTGLLRNVVGPEHYHDLGKLLFAFTVFWAYIGFSQYFLIWYGNIPEETIFFRERLTGSWQGASFLLAAGHFVIPFFFFMPRTIKRRPAALAVGSVWLLLMNFLDLYWLVMPSLHPGGVHVTLLDLTTLAAVGGAFVGSAAWLMRRAPLVPVRDPRLSESLSFENA